MCHVLVVNSYPDPLPLSEILYPPLYSVGVLDVYYTINKSQDQSVQLIYNESHGCIASQKLNLTSCHHKETFTSVAMTTSLRRHQYLPHIHKHSVHKIVINISFVFFHDIPESTASCATAGIRAFYDSDD